MGDSSLESQVELTDFLNFFFRMNMNQNTQAQLTLAGSRETGTTVRSANVLACNTIANYVKSSLGPVGLDKMLVDDVGEVTITNDGATILKLLDIKDPAAKVLVECAQLQDREVGDGTTSVTLLAAELLKKGDKLVKQKIHPNTVLAGYKLACKVALKWMKNNLTISTNDLGEGGMIAAAKTSMSSKIINDDSDFFAKMCVTAANAVKFSNNKGGHTYPIKAINVLKAHGKSQKETTLIDGYALNCVIGSQQMPKTIEKAKIAFLDFSLMKAKMKMGVHVLVSDPEKLQQIRQREADITKERIQMILSAGANVILCTGGIDDMNLKYFVDANCMAVRRCLKKDMKRIAKATGGTIVSSLATLEGDEAYEASNLGVCESVKQERVCDDELLILRGMKQRTAASIIIRGANDFMCDEIERAVHDALCVIKRVGESKSVVPGGGCVEAALSIFLENYASTMASKEQLAVSEFAQALLVIPRTLAVNAAKDAAELVAKLRSLHDASQRNVDHKHLRWLGLDLYHGKIRDNHKAGVYEPTLIKTKSIRFATEAAITILRIDDKIKLIPEQKEKTYADALAAGELDG